MKRLQRIAVSFALLVLISLSSVAVSEDAADLAAAQETLDRKDFSAAEVLASRLIEANPKQADAYLTRAAARDALGKYDEATDDITHAIKLKPNNAAWHYMRGDLRFKAGDISGSLADYDREIELAPERKQRHWQRGIVCYYAGKYAEGARQFALYQTYDDNDVENVVWRFACMARDVGVEKAHAEMLKVRKDRRVPMMKIYDVFRGTAKPEDVLAAAETEGANPQTLNYQRFYAHYYLGLYFECIGKHDLARPHLLAAATHKNEHYMWHVARIHAARLAEAKATKE